MKAPKAKVISISAPSVLGALATITIPFAFFVKGRFVTLEFECGSCGVVSEKQWQDDTKHIKCPICKTVNKVKRYE